MNVVGSILPELQWQGDTSFCQEFPAGVRVRSRAYHFAIWQGQLVADVSTAQHDQYCEVYSSGLDLHILYK